MIFLNKRYSLFAVLLLAVAIFAVTFTLNTENALAA
jgi:hypothetical protein